jgi:hypothetical protein
LAARLELPAAPGDPESCFDELTKTVGYFNGLSYRALGHTGANPSKQKVETAAV